MQNFQPQQQPPPQHPQQQPPQIPTLPNAPSNIDLRFSGSSLRGPSGAPDAFAVVFLRTFGLHDWIEVGRTETVPASQHPNWQRVIQVPFLFERFQDLRIAVFDRESDSENLAAHALVGAVDGILANVVTQPSALTWTLQNAQMKLGQPGSILINLHEASNALSRKVDINLALSQLPKPPAPSATQFMNQSTVAAREKFTSLFNKKNTNDHSQQQQSQATQQQLQSAWDQQWEIAIEIVHRLSYDDPSQRRQAAFFQNVSKNPDAPSSFSVSAQALNQGQDNAVLQFEAYYYNKLNPYFTQSETSKTTNNQQEQQQHPKILIGSVSTSMSALRILSSGATLTLQPQGVLHITKIAEVAQPSLLDYFRSNMLKLALITGIDFTSSNGDPKSNNSLHFIDQSGRILNPYEALLRGLGNILLNYASDKPIAAYGFGANLPPDWHISHCFAITGNPAQPYCSSIDELIRTYKTALLTVQLYGPTVLSEVVRTAATIVARSLPQQPYATYSPQNPVKYYTLLLLTDGVLSDADSLVIELIRASTLPLSVIIVGVGQENFNKMYFLNQKGPLRAGNAVAVRDNILFVSYNQFQGDVSQLAAHVLQEIPLHIVDYMNREHIVPPNVQATRFGI